MTRPNRRHALLLTALVLFAQSLLAWHMPSHLHDHQPLAAFDSNHSGAHGHASDSDTDTCPLGINGHGLALIHTPVGPAFDVHSPHARLEDISHPDAGAKLTPSARGPPLHA
jgi:hypothetical protein